MFGQTILRTGLPGDSILAANRAIARLPHLGTFLEGEGAVAVGWGRKRSGRNAARLARRKGQRLILLEDGFIRSTGRRDAPQSLLIDDLGVHYDATGPSRMESAITSPLPPESAARAMRLVRQWTASGVSKYNHAAEYQGKLPPRYVLVVDQTAGDPAIALGLADQARFAAMLEAALDEFPRHAIVLKTHPDVFSHGKARNFTPRLLSHPRVQVIDAECHPALLLDNADAVYTVTSLMGFEGLLRGKLVRCFGMPFYAGWGLTQDLLEAPARRGHASLAQLVHAALVDRARYIDPANGTPSTPEDTIARIGDWRAAGSHLAERRTAMRPRAKILQRLSDWWAR